jgi:hypothetical protein
MALLIKLLQQSTDHKHCVHQFVSKGTLPVLHALGHLEPLTRAEISPPTLRDARMGNDRPRMNEEREAVLINMPIAAPKL